ncbi:MAG: hypothetical protein RLZ98_2712, partial [Pseudomonadota bacterium]
MTRISRRDAIVGVAGLAGAALTTQLLVPSAHAAAPMLGAKRPEIYRFKLGDFEVTTILDGTVVRKGIHPTFGQDQGKDIVGTLAEANNLSAAALENPYTPVLVNTGKQLVLFDTGNGERRRKSGSGNLLRLLQEAGYRPEQIDLVVVTHGHPDHVGGLLE